MDSPEPPRQPQRGHEYVGVIARVTVNAVATLPDGEKVPVTLQEDASPWVWFTGTWDGYDVPAEIENDLDRGARDFAVAHLRDLGLTYYGNESDAQGAIVRRQDYGRIRDLLSIKDEPLPNHGSLSNIRFTIDHEMVSMPWAAHHWAWQQDVDPTEGEAAVAAWAESVALESERLD